VAGWDESFQRHVYSKLVMKSDPLAAGENLLSVGRTSDGWNMEDFGKWAFLRARTGWSFVHFHFLGESHSRHSESRSTIFTLRPLGLAASPSLVR
jgi:hypothetical protein